MDVEKFSSPEFHRAAVEMFKLQALCSYKYIYISISHLKCECSNNRIEESCSTKEKKDQCL